MQNTNNLLKFQVASISSNWAGARLQIIYQFFYLIHNKTRGLAFTLYILPFSDGIFYIIETDI
jgi:hypothetical protein